MPGTHLPGPLVDAAWLADDLGADGLVVADVRWYLDGRSGREAHRAGHIPGAVFVDLDRDLAAPPGAGPGRHPLPRPEAFTAVLDGLGIGEGDAVVAYDDAGGSIAARLWWMLDVTGRAAAVLDGGLPAWVAAGGALEVGDVPRAPAGRAATSPPEVRPWPPGAVVDADEVARAVSSGSAAVLDARAPERYRGEVEPVDPRPGHIPGALSAPWAANLHPATMRFLPPHALRERYEALGAGGTSGPISSCGSGVTACHDLLAMAVAGLGGGRLYEGSWSDWSSDPSRPAALGPAPGGDGTDVRS